MIDHSRMIDRMSNIIQTLKYKTVRNVVGFLGVFFGSVSLSARFWVLCNVLCRGEGTDCTKHLTISIICVVNHFNALYIINIYYAWRVGFKGREFKPGRGESEVELQ